MAFVALAFLTMPVAADEPTNPDPRGTYQCTSERTVGLQDDGNGTRQAAGIIPDDKHATFSITINKVTRTDNLSLSKDGWQLHSPSFCFSTNKITELQDEWASDDFHVSGLKMFVLECLATYETRTSDGHLFFSIGGLYFTGMLPAEFFWIGTNLRFTRSFRIQSNFYLSEGRSSPVE